MNWQQVHTLIPLESWGNSQGLTLLSITDCWAVFKTAAMENTSKYSLNLDVGHHKVNPVAILNQIIQQGCVILK